MTSCASATLASVTSPVTAPVAGLVTGAQAPLVPANDWLLRQWLIVFVIVSLQLVYFLT
ncbi:hypothetical protein [Mycobacterium sp. EPa45]|uniref:hypothetical protein n=1 Tax=Mycobacterium sp. EPa45 TaxID=1545728 RepID=UPI001395EBD5|nr:hypothetical protein [Mycobacterium sp. EPa45]